jgi:hypothetical protein
VNVIPLFQTEIKQFSVLFDAVWKQTALEAANIPKSYFPEYYKNCHLY